MGPYAHALTNSLLQVRYDELDGLCIFQELTT